MSYVGIGNRQDYIADFPTQEFSGNSTTTTFTLNFEAVTGAVRVAVDNVLQPADGSSYYVNGNSLTFTSAPASGTNNISVVYLGTVRNISSVSDNAITAAKLNSAAITGQTAETSVADDDLVLIYDDSATALRKMTKSNFVGSTGKIGQVIQDSKSNQFETSSTSFVDSSFSASITPTSASSKILIMCSTSAIHIATTGAGGETLIKFYRGGTAIGDEYQVAKSRQDSSYNQEVGGGGTAMYLDSPATTSSITYNVYARITNGSAGRICQAGHGGTLTLMEVLA